MRCAATRARNVPSFPWVVARRSRKEAGLIRFQGVTEVEGQLTVDAENFHRTIDGVDVDNAHCAGYRFDGTQQILIILHNLHGKPGFVQPADESLDVARLTVKIVENDEDLLRTVEAIPGAVGIVDVYSINSSVKV